MHWCLKVHYSRGTRTLKLRNEKKIDPQARDKSTVLDNRKNQNN